MDLLHTPPDRPLRPLSRAERTASGFLSRRRRAGLYVALLTFAAAVTLYAC